MSDNAFNKEEKFSGRCFSSCYPRFFDPDLTIKIKDVCVYDCIQIIKGFNRHFNIKTVLIRRHGGGSA